MNLKYLIYFLLAAFSVTASNIEDIKTWSRIKDPLRHLERAYKFQTPGYTTEKRRYLLSSMISEKSNYFRWNSFQDIALLVEDFMAIGADLNTRDSDAEPLLRAAALNGNLKSVTLLLDYGVDVNTTNSNRETALCASIYRGRKEIAHLLLGRGADPLIGDTLWRAIRGEFIPDRMIPCIGMIEPDSKLANELADNFVKGHISLGGSRSFNPSHPFLDACLDNITNQAKLKELFQKAVKNWRVRVVQALLDRGCSWRQLDLRKIFESCKIRLKKRYYTSQGPYNPKAIAEFINVGMLEGATFNEMDALLSLLKMIRDKKLYANVLKLYREKKDSKLRAAALNGDLKVVSSLLNHGADVNATDSDGETALSLSILYSHQEISYLLLERGADPLIGKTLQHAIRGEFIPDRIIPCIGMIEPDSKLANELAHVFVEDEVSLSVRRYLFPSRPFLDACLDNITNKERLQELFQKAVKKWRVTVVQALLERGCSWRQLDLKLFLIESKREVINLMSFFGALRPPTMVGLAMAEFIKMGLLEGATLDEMDDLLYLLKMMEYDDLHAEVLKAYREKERENSYWTCNIS